MVDTAYEMEDSEKEAFKRIRDQPNYVWSGRLIEFVFAYSGFDPFASIEAYRNRTGGWKLRLTRRWLKLSMLISIYLPIKTLTIFFVRSTAGELDIAQNKHPRSELGCLLWLLGDPYFIPPHPDMVMYILRPLTVLWIKCFMPIYMQRVEHFDCSIARFILEPAREIHLFDLQASQLLTNTIEAVEHQRWILSRNFRFEQRSREEFELFFAKQSQIRRQLSIMREVKRQIHQVRPKALRPEWHQLNRTVAPILYLLATVLLIMIGELVVNHSNSMAWNGRCKRLSLLMTNSYSQMNSDCSLLEAFSYQDLLLMLESALYCDLLALIPGGVVMTFHFLQTIHQLYHTSNIAGGLRELLAELRTWTASQQLEVDGGSISDPLSRRLCSNIVRIWMFERHSRSSITALCHGLRLSVAFCLSSTALMFATVRLLASTVKQLSLNEETAILAESATLDMHKTMTVFLATWGPMMLQLTAIQLACASVPSRIARIDKLVYSLVAELIRIQQTGRTANDLERLGEHDCCFPMDDPITNLWRLQMLSRRSNADRATVCMFGTKFTYERVLAMQFYYATIISILYSYI